VLASLGLNLVIFSDILSKKSISICLFDLFDTNIPEEHWFLIKLFYFIITSISCIFISLHIFNNSKKSTSNSKEKESFISSGGLSLKVGNALSTNEEIIIPERGLYQNILITGTIGTGKTSSAMYPFLDQLLNRNLGMLILDVKGNFYKKVLELNKKYNRNVIVIELNGKYKYNPLDKPSIKPAVLANRLKTVLSTLSNQNNSDSYWLDKVEIYLTECIKLCRLYNDGYVTFIELHKLINNPDYLKEKTDYIKNLFLSNKLSQNQIFDFNTCLDFFQNEYSSLDSKVLSIIQSEVTRITQVFVSDSDISSTFCPQKDEPKFSRFFAF
jgi:hypothetical protein